MELFAAPVREIWFSIARGFTSTNRLAPSNQISAGDLLSSRGRVVKRNIDLVGRLGVMPIVPDLGLDAVDVTRRGEILFSIPVDVFSETLGRIQHGDLLSNRGAIVRRNQELLAAFKPADSVDAQFRTAWKNADTPAGFPVPVTRRVEPVRAHAPV